MHKENAYICRLLFVICLYMIETSEAIIVTQIQLSSLSYSVLTFMLTLEKKQDRSFGVAFGHREAALPLGHWKVKCQDFRILFYFPLIRPQTCILLTL